MRSIVAPIGCDGGRVLPELCSGVGGVSGTTAATEHAGTGDADDPGRLRSGEDPHGRRCTMSAAAVMMLPMVQAAAVALVQLRTRRVPLQPELAFYRKYTEGMLRRYVRLSMEKGRVPSLMGTEMFRGRVTSYKIRSFEDVVIFTHDVEKCLRKLTIGEQRLLERIALQEYTQGDAAGLLGMSLRTVVRRYPAAVDVLTGHFLEMGLMEPLLECQAEDDED